MEKKILMQIFMQVLDLNPTRHDRYFVKNLGEKLKIRVEKVVFSFFPLKFDDVIKYYFIISTIILKFP